MKTFKINMKPFVADKHDCRAAIWTPWIVDDSIVATTGRIMVIIEKDYFTTGEVRLSMPPVQGSSDHPKIAALLEGKAELCSRTLLSTSLVPCKSFYHETPVKSRTCRVCYTKNGTENLNIARLHLSGDLYLDVQAKYIDAISKFPDLEIKASACEYSMIYFTFRYGFGLFMPIRRPEQEE